MLNRSQVCGYVKSLPFDQHIVGDKLFLNMIILKTILKFTFWNSTLWYKNKGTFKIPLIGLKF